MLLQESTHHLSANEHFGFLSQLAQNDSLRAELAQNPAETLRRFGIQMPEASAKVTLPTKEALAFHLGGLKGDNDPSGPIPPWGAVHV